MTTRFRVALQGFSDFERDALSSSLRLAGARQPSYRLVPAIAGCDFIVADADHARVRDALVAAGRLEDTIFIGEDGPEGAPALLPRPIDTLRVLQALDRLADRLVPLPPEGSGFATVTLEADPVVPPTGDDDSTEPMGFDERPIAPAPRVDQERDEDPVAAAAPGWSGSLLFLSEGGSASTPPASPPLAVLPPSDAFEFPPLLFDAVPAPPVAAPTAPARETWHADALPSSFSPEESTFVDPTSPSPGAAPPGSADVGMIVEDEAERARRAEAKFAARAAARRARLRAAGLPEDDAVTDVLVLDDSEIARRHLGQLLLNFGFGVHAVAASDEAIRLLAERPFVAAFLDIDLAPTEPEDGLELCRRIAQAELRLAGERPRLLMVSGQGVASDRVRAKLAGCDVYLEKPLTRGDVARALESCRVRLPSDARRL